MAVIGQDIYYAKRLLEQGELVAIPTETVYGLAANALNTRALARIFEVKRRPRFDPLILHIRQTDELPLWVEHIPATLQKLAEQFWPGPLTLVLPKRPHVPDLLTAGLPTVAIRVPAHPLTQALLQQLTFPLAAPSANPFGYVSPTQATHVAKQLGEQLAYILDGGPCQVGLESTIVGWDDTQCCPKVLRLGGLSLEALEAVAGPLLVQNHSSSRPAAPGMLTQHYAPGKPVFLSLSEALQHYQAHQLASIVLSEPLAELPIQHQLILSPSGQLHEAAQRLFAALRQAEQLDVQAIVAPLVPELGLGRAINDRLRRAAARQASRFD